MIGHEDVLFSRPNVISAQVHSKFANAFGIPLKVFVELVKEAEI